MFNPLPPSFFEQFSSFSSGGAIWLFFLAAAIIYAGFSLVVLYHWIRYSESAVASLFALVVYFLVSGFLFLIALSAAVSLTLL